MFCPTTQQLWRIHPFQSELFGICPCLRQVYHISKEYKLPKRKLKIYSDCEGAIKTIQKQYPISVKHIFADDANILCELRFLYKKTETYCRPAPPPHVRSHQNKKLKFNNLSVAAQINHNYFEPNFEKTKYNQFPSHLSRMHIHLPNNHISFTPPLQHKKWPPLTPCLNNAQTPPRTHNSQLSWRRQQIQDRTWYGRAFGT